MKRNHTKLICDISELTGLFHDSHSLSSCLQKTVEMIANHMQSDVCSIYLYYEAEQELVLRATKGLNKSAIGKVRLALGEGLTGRALKELNPIYEKRASKNMHYRFFPGIGEEEYESFLAVPIVRGNNRIGAIVIQSKERGAFDDDDINVFRAITSQLATTVETAKLLMNLDRVLPSENEISLEKPSLIKGRSGAPGAAYGPAAMLSHDHGRAFFENLDIKGEWTKKDFSNAVVETESQLEELQKQIEETLFDVASLIFTAHILMLKDTSFIGAINERIDGGESPPYAIRSVVFEFVAKFQQMDSDYLKEKAHDVMDVGKRLIENLIGIKEGRSLYDECIVIADELFPSDALKLFSQGAKGIILLTGGVTSHLAILCRSLNIPMVIANDRRMMNVLNGEMIQIDAASGTIYFNPEQALIDQIQERETLAAQSDDIKQAMQAETFTQDGYRVTLLANVNLLGDANVAKAFKAEGVGLYRSEFPFMVRSAFPSEEEQFVIYRRLVEMMEGYEISFRTLDIGGDKVLSYYESTKEENPFLGLRSIRFSLEHKDIFQQQIKAILRAGYDTRVRIMFPMVSSVDELMEAKKVVADSMRALKEEKQRFCKKSRIGMMIELPSVIDLMDDLCKEVEFFSIGTNDLIQYLLAVDRTNEKVADWYLPHHPSVLRSLARIMEVAQKNKRPVTVCGDMAHDARYIPFLIGIGVNKLSVGPRHLPIVQKTIQSLDYGKAQKFAADLLAQNRIDIIEKKLGLK